MAETQYTLDTGFELKDAGLVAASAAATVDAAAKIINLGAACKLRGEILIDITALEIASNDEAYTIVLQGSSDADFGTAANIHELCHYHFGAKETKLTDCDKDDTTGRYILPFVNYQASTVYQYLRLYTVVAGTIATGINYTAWMCKSK